MKIMFFRRITKSSVLFFIVAFVFAVKTLADDHSSADSTKDYITPFGGIDWTNTPLQVLAKLSKIEGVTNVHLNIQGKTTKVSLLGIQDSKSLVAALKEAGWFPATKTTYLNAEGKERKYPAGIFGVVDGEMVGTVDGEFIASPITVAEMSFTLKVQFGIEPGLALETPQNVLTDPENGIDLPIVIVRVELSTRYASDDPGINSVPAKFDKLSDTLIAKYSHFDKNGEPDKLFHNLKETGMAQATDKNGTVVTATWRGDISVYKLAYENYAYFTKLKEAYEKNYESHSKPKGPDQSDKL
jgi:hypothetical protein